MSDDAARYVRDAIRDHEARSTVDAWDRLDTATRERDRAAAEADRLAAELDRLTAEVSPPPPQPGPSTLQAPPPAREPFDPDLQADRILQRIRRGP